MPNFTPELSSEYLAKLLNETEARKASSIGLARQEGQSGGLAAQAAMGTRIGAAETEAASEQANTVSKFNFDVAGLDREKRLTQEGRAFDMSEAEKQRKEQERLMRMGFDFQSGEREAQNRFETVQSQQGALFGSITGLTMLGAGMYAGSKKGKSGSTGNYEALNTGRNISSYSGDTGSGSESEESESDWSESDWSESD